MTTQHVVRGEDSLELGMLGDFHLLEKFLHHDPETCAFLSVPCRPGGGAHIFEKL